MPPVALPHRRGHFLLESGLHGDLWIELDAFIADPAKVRPLAYELADKLPVWEIEAILGPKDGGAVVAALAGEALGLPAFAVDRHVVGSEVSYALPEPVTYEFKGKKVAILDDVIGAGSATKGTLRACRAAGIIPIALGALYESGYANGRLAIETGLPVFSLGVIGGSIWAPVECPLCQANVPLELPGAMP